MQQNIKNGTMEIKKIAKIKGKLSSGPDMIASTISKSRANNFHQENASDEGTHYKQISRTIDTTQRPNT